MVFFSILESLERIRILYVLVVIAAPVEKVSVLLPSGCTPELSLFCAVHQRSSSGHRYSS